MLKITLSAALLLLTTTSFAKAPISTLNCTVIKTKETFSMKVRIGTKIIEDIIANKDDQLVTTNSDDVAYLGAGEISELKDGSQVIETDMDGIEMYTLVLTSKSQFLKGTFKYRVIDHSTSSGKSYSSEVVCTKK